MKTIAVLVTMFGTCTAALEWLHILYRVQLFVGHYGCRRGVNHIGDGEFVLWYVFHGFFILVLTLAAWALWKEPGRWRSVACWAGVAHVAACLALFTMHSTGILVEYEEFMRYGVSAPNNWVQATPVYAFLFILSQRPGAPDPGR